MKKRNLSVILIPLACLLVLSNPVLAKENDSDADVSIEITQAEQYILQVIAQGPGDILDGNQHIREGSVKYSIGLGRTKEFEIKPDKDSIIQSVIYERPALNDKQDITKDIKGNKVAIDIESTEMILTVTFAKAQSENEKVETGDITKRIVYIVGISISLCSMLLIIRHKKKQVCTKSAHKD